MRRSEIPVDGPKRKAVPMPQGGREMKLTGFTADGHGDLPQTEARVPQRQPCSFYTRGPRPCERCASRAQFYLVGDSRAKKTDVWQSLGPMKLVEAFRS